MISYSKNTLSNGLTLLHHHDPSTPFVVLNLLYKVGAKNEDAERTGFAHLFEHLMFEGTKEVPNFDQPLQEAGGINNAFTNNDYTNYYIKLPKENIELALYLEADRMQNLNINEQMLNTQKKVVIEEFKENYTNKPYGDVWHILRSMVYEQHPYQWPTIGKDHQHIAEAQLSDVISFYKHYYHPANLVLCIAGNISESKALELSNKYLGTIINNQQSNGQSFDEPLQKQEKKKALTRDVPLDALYIAFKMPGRLDETYYTADILSDVLAGSKSARFKERLVKQQQLFVNVDAYITGSVDTGIFVVEGRLRECVSMADAESAVWKELDLMTNLGPDQEELQKVKNKLITYMNFSENNLLSRAIGLSFHEMLGDANRINEEEKHYMAVETEDVVQFCSNFLNRQQSTTLHYLKEN